MTLNSKKSTCWLLAVCGSLACIACGPKHVSSTSTVVVPPADPSAYVNIPCQSARAAGTSVVIDDFESEPNRITRVESRDGEWFSFDDGTGGKLVREEIEGNTRLLHVSASAFRKWGAGVGATLSAATSKAQACGYDASVYSGLRFRARGHGRVRVQLTSVSTTPKGEGGRCTRNRDSCYDSPGVWVDLKEQWQTITRPYCAFLPEGWGGAMTAIDPAQLVNVQFKIPPHEDFELWLDDLAFFKAESAAEATCGHLCPLEQVPANAKLNPSASNTRLSQELTLHTFPQTTKSCGALIRRYFSYVPKGLAPSSSAPIVMVLHGSGANAEGMLQYQTRSRFEELAKRDGFIVIYGNAAPGSHTDPSPYMPNSGAWRQGYYDDGEVDDVAYLIATLDDLKARGVTNGNNAVYLTGISNGGGMVLKAGKEAPDRFRGIAPLMAFDGTMPTPVPDLRGKALNRVLFVYTLNDPGLPPGYHEILKTLPAEWAKKMGLPSSVIDAPKRTDLPDRIHEGAEYKGNSLVARSTRDSRAIAYDMSDAALNAALRIVVIDHAGHFWPHPRGEWFDWAIDRWGFRNQDFDAADLVWGFFSSGAVK